jgi:hypothetical protein
MSEALRVHIQSPGTLEFPKANNLQVSEPDADKDVREASALDRER